MCFGWWTDCHWTTASVVGTLQSIGTKEGIKYSKENTMTCSPKPCKCYQIIEVVEMMLTASWNTHIRRAGLGQIYNTHLYGTNQPHRRATV